MDENDGFDFRTLVSLIGLYVGLQNLGFNQKQDAHRIPDILSKILQQNEILIKQNQEILNLLKGDKNDSTRNL